MGMSLHKAIGWALTDVTTDESGHRIADPRINTASTLLDWDNEATAAQYLAWLEARTGDAETDATLDRWALRDALRDRDAGQPPTSRRTLAALSPFDAVTHAGEYGLGSVLHLRPVSCADWHQRNNVIDSVTEMLGTWDGEPHVEVLPSNPYPFSGSWMDAATGQRLPDAVMTWVRLQARLRAPDLDPQDRAKIEIACDVAAADHGFADADEARERIVPAVPGEIRALCAFGDLFTTADVWRQLRPVLYTYYS